MTCTPAETLENEIIQMIQRAQSRIKPESFNVENANDMQAILTFADVLGIKNIYALGKEGHLDSENLARALGGLSTNTAEQLGGTVQKLWQRGLIDSDMIGFFADTLSDGKVWESYGKGYYAQMEDQKVAKDLQKTEEAITHGKRDVNPICETGKKGFGR